MDWAHLLDLLGASIRIATPLMFAAMGGILSERAGVFAVGLEGMMLSGACGAVIGTVLFGDPLAGLFCAALGGAVLAVAIAIVTVRFGADNMVTGIAANILAVGLTSFLVRTLLGHGTAPRIHLDLLGAVRIPGLADLPGIGPLLFDQPWLTYLACLVPLPLTLLLDRTRWGLTLRAAGENPLAVFAVGGDPIAIRQRAVIACGAVAGIGGAVLVLQQVGTFTDNMTAGRGYLALAAIIVGRWMPWPTLAATLLFSAAEALYLRIQVLSLPVSSYVVQMLPYVLAIAVLVGLGRSARLPAAVGTAFRRDGK
jgi:simple sugar transport system permease protein